MNRKEFIKCKIKKYIDSNKFYFIIKLKNYMKTNINNYFIIGILFIFILQIQEIKAQYIISPDISLSNKEINMDELSLLQRPTKRIYYTGGAQMGMFLLQGAYAGNQMISIEPYGKYVGENFFATLALPIRFKTSPVFSDIGLDINVLYPFLGKNNKSELDPYIGGGMGLHFIGRNDSQPDQTHITARGGLGLNIIGGVVFFKNYDFNVTAELKYFIYLREFGDRYYHGIGLNIGATLPH